MMTLVNITVQGGFSREAILMEDPDIIVDLCELNSNESDKYDIFWNYCKSFLQECTAVHK